VGDFVSGAAILGNAARPAPKGATIGRDPYVGSPTDNHISMCYETAAFWRHEASSGGRRASTAGPPATLLAIKVRLAEAKAGTR
jgi:hypothetical protein